MYLNQTYSYTIKPSLIPAVITIVILILCITLIRIAPVWRIYLILTGITISLYWLNYYLFFKNQTITINPQLNSVTLQKTNQHQHYYQNHQQNEHKNKHKKITNIKNYGTLITIIWSPKKNLIFIDSVPLTCYKQLRGLAWNYT